VSTLRAPNRRACRLARAGLVLSGDPGAIGANRSNFHSCTTRTFGATCERMPNISCRRPLRSEGNVVSLIAVGRCLAVDQPDDLIVGCAGSTGEVEAISIPSTSPPSIARLKPVPGVPRVASRCARHESAAICSGLPAHRRSAHSCRMGTRDHFRRIGPGSGRPGDGSTQGSRRLAVEAWCSALQPPPKLDGSRFLFWSGGMGG